MQLEYCVKGISECDATQGTLGESGKGVRGECNYAECMCRPVRLFANSSGVMQPRAPGQETVGCEGGCRRCSFCVLEAASIAATCTALQRTSHDLT